MKEKNIEVIQTIIENLLDGEFFRIEEYFPHDAVVWILTNIYLNNDTSVEVTNRVKDVGSVIASRDRISLIMEREVVPTTQQFTYVKTDDPLCLYQDTAQDIFNILSIWETCALRLGL